MPCEFGAVSGAAGSPAAARAGVSRTAPRRPDRPAGTSSALDGYSAARLRAACARSAATFCRAGSTPASCRRRSSHEHVGVNTKPTTSSYEQRWDFTPAAPNSNRCRNHPVFARRPITGSHRQVTAPPRASFWWTRARRHRAVDRLHVIVSGGTPASPGTEYANYTSAASHRQPGDGVHGDGRRGS